ncbi:unnamed protein product [Ambrosiozyma monospora]|uniref:Unnamed protein product n=1 Tax=Ambrosiozyma monospora TaxID=43982 RepID=A0A9W6Z0P3_AMBMO|nr:unnamed protein product [Ambrosiozyma monospora]
MKEQYEPPPPASQNVQYQPHEGHSQDHQLNATFRPIPPPPTTEASPPPALNMEFYWWIFVLLVLVSFGPRIWRSLKASVRIIWEAFQMARGGVIETVQYDTPKSSRFTTPAHSRTSSLLNPNTTLKNRSFSVNMARPAHSRTPSVVYTPSATDIKKGFGDQTVNDDEGPVLRRTHYTAFKVSKTEEFRKNGDIKTSYYDLHTGELTRFKHCFPPETQMTVESFKVDDKHWKMIVKKPGCTVEREMVVETLPDPPVTFHSRSVSSPNSSFSYSVRPQHQYQPPQSQSQYQDLQQQQLKSHKRSASQRLKDVLGFTTTSNNNNNNSHKRTPSQALASMLGLGQYSPEQNIRNQRHKKHIKRITNTTMRFEDGRIIRGYASPSVTRYFVEFPNRTMKLVELYRENGGVKVETWFLENGVKAEITTFPDGADRRYLFKDGKMLTTLLTEPEGMDDEFDTTLC